MDSVQTLTYLHDRYLREAREQLQLRLSYARMKKEQPDNPGLTSNLRLHQGKEAALYTVVNDLRHLLNLPPLEESSHYHGYAYNEA